MIYLIYVYVIYVSVIIGLRWVNSLVFEVKLIFGKKNFYRYGGNSES